MPTENTIQKIKREELEKEFFDRLAEKLEEIFPKTNQDNPEIPSEGNRSGALALNAFANLIFRDILGKAEDNIIKGVLEEVKGKIGILRQLLNEHRITEPSRMIDNEYIEKVILEDFRKRIEGEMKK